MMTTRGQVKAGEKVMILGAAGGVGTAACSLPRRPARKSSPAPAPTEKLEKLKEMGADHVVNTATTTSASGSGTTLGKPRMGQSGGIDLMVNYIGGDTWVDCLKSIGPGGRMVLCGATQDYKTDNDCRYIWTYEIIIIGSNGWTMEDQAEMMRMVTEDEITPVIDCVLPLERDRHRRAETDRP